ncbi:MAG: citrate transporter, partial [Alphaproteobacteria bacterium]|nr:citrate transporter [Alphaproteobacteria bacterium]
MDTVMTALAAAPGQLMSVPVEFYIFGLTLLGVALFHHRTLTAALCGLATTVVYKLIFSGFAHGAGFAGLAAHASHEGVILSNLLLLLLG